MFNYCYRLCLLWLEFVCYKNRRMNKIFRLIFLSWIDSSTHSIHKIFALSIHSTFHFHFYFWHTIEVCDESSLLVTWFLRRQFFLRPMMPNTIPPDIHWLVFFLVLLISGSIQSNNLYNVNAFAFGVNLFQIQFHNLCKLWNILFIIKRNNHSNSFFLQKNEKNITTLLQ